MNSRRTAKDTTTRRRPTQRGVLVSLVLDLCDRLAPLAVKNDLFAGRELAQWKHDPRKPFLFDMGDGRLLGAFSMAKSQSLLST